MPLTRPATIVSAALFALLLSGCTGEAQQPSGQTPEARDDAAILVALEQVDPGLNTDASIDDAQEICKDIDDGVATDEIDVHARELFSDQAQNALSEDQARQVVQIVLTDFCPAN